MAVARVVSVVFGYVAGTVPTAVWIGRLLGRDPTREGSGNPGASNVYRLAGPRAGATVFLVDLAKGALAAGVGLAVDGRTLALACGLAAVAGHVLPVTRRFVGGRGVATAAGIVLVLYPLVAVPVVMLWLVVVRATHTASLASVAAVVAAPVGVVLTGRPGPEVAFVGVIAAIVLVRHVPNLIRLARGEERTLAPSRLPSGREDGTLRGGVGQRGGGS